ncbi:MAG: hypothetical protein C4554_10385 [Dethiobacter sp.]|nr:MAG: hypothetical protein C4554_10385 [Dethiobacter sp.]
MDFDRWLQRFVTAIEKIIFRVALALVVLLFIVQAMLINGNLRLFLSKTDRMEGKPVLQNIQDVMGRKITGAERPVSPAHEEITLVLELRSPPGISCNLFLLVNNQVAGQFGEENISITVQPGDLLEVIGEVSGETPAAIRVVEVYGKLKAPGKGHEIKTFGERDLLAWIIP